jgi:hypothetical protein
VKSTLGSSQLKGLDLDDEIFAVALAPRDMHLAKRTSSKASSHRKVGEAQVWRRGQVW